MTKAEEIAITTQADKICKKHNCSLVWIDFENLNVEIDSVENCAFYILKDEYIFRKI